MKKISLLLTMAGLFGALIMSPVIVNAEIKTAFGFDQSSQIQETPASEQTSSEDTEPQPEPGPSRSGRLLPVRR